MIRMIFSDMDETLLVDHHVPEINRKAVRAAVEKGVCFVPATGRSFFMIQEILRELGLYRQKKAYSICFNGAAVYENNNPLPLYMQAMEAKQIRAVITIFQRYEVCMMVFTLHELYLLHPTQSELQRKKKQKADFVVLDELSQLPKQDIMKIVFQSDDSGYLFEIGNEQQRLLQEAGVEVSYSSGRYIEFMKRGATKGNALLWLCDHLHLEASQTMAIGDNFNDISMLENAGIGVCVASGREEAKAVSSYVTKRDYAQGAVAEAIGRFVL